MEIQTEKYGTTGLPKFGPGYHGAAVGTAGDTTEAVAKLDAAFNNLIAVVKQNAVAGNSMILWYFGAGLKGLYGLAFSCVTEKPVINA